MLIFRFLNHKSFHIHLLKKPVSKLIQALLYSNNYLYQLGGELIMTIIKTTMLYMVKFIIF